MNILNELYQNKLITPPPFVVDNICLLSIGGSFAYGCSTDNSDVDLIGVCIPPIEYIQPKGILGFDEMPKFDEYQQHHIKYENKEYDVKVYSIARLFKLALDGNPNMLDIISTPDYTVLEENSVGNKLRANKDLFYSKDCVKRFLGFANNHFRSMENRIKSGEYPSKRRHLFEKFGYDTKDAGHCLRALLSIEQILLHGTYEINQFGPIIKDVREGKYPYGLFKDMCEKTTESVKRLKENSTLRDKPDVPQIRALLVDLLTESGITL